ncbi:MAG: glycosyltransferase family 2 protein [Chthoniobacteraceae bacterium]
MGFLDVGHDTPVVSVVMPMRNAAPFVEGALRSVLAEDRLELEVVVVDDGSTDGSADVVRSLNDPRIILIDGPRTGIAACLNHGFAAARAEIVMRCDADDLYPPGRLAAQARWLGANRDYGAVCSGFAMVSLAGRLITRFGSGAEHLEMDVEGELQRGVLRTTLCAFAWRKGLFKDTPMFRDYFETAEDLDFQMRLGESCRVKFCPGVAYFYRLHDTSTTHTQATTRRLFFENVAYEFQMQRRQGRGDALERGDPPVPPDGQRSAPSKAADQIQGILIGRAWAELEAGHPARAVATAVRSVAISPFSIEGWSSFAKVLLRATVLRGPRVNPSKSGN